VSRFVSPSSRATTLSYEGPGPSFYRCKERVQVYNGRVVRGVVAVGGAFEPCRSTAVGAAGTLLTSPCFCRGLRATVVMDARGEPSLLVTEVSLDGTPVLFPRSLS
jgi:hypothetical protein